MHSFGSSAGARRLFATSILARLPPAMLSIGLLVHVHRLTGSFAAAGVVTGVYAIALGAGGPLLGTLVDHRGQTAVLLVSASAAALLLVAIALQPAAPRSPSCSRSPPASGSPPRRSAPACALSSRRCCPIPAPSAPPTRSRRPWSS